MFSVGFGGNRDGYSFLARWWAGRGYEVAVVEHVGSNLDVLKSLDRRRLDEEVVRCVTSTEEARDRPLDLGFVCRCLAREGEPLGLGGHSFGAYTALATALREPACRCVLAMSWQAPGPLLGEDQYRRLSTPVLLVTGTEDVSPLDTRGPQQRLEAFDLIPEGHKRMAVVQGAHHMVFANVGLDVIPFHGPLRRLTTTFWEQYLRDGPPLDRALALEAVGQERLALWQEG